MLHKICNAYWGCVTSRWSVTWRHAATAELVERLFLRQWTTLAWVRIPVQPIT